MAQDSRSESPGSASNYAGNHASWYDTTDHRATRHAWYRQYQQADQNTYTPDTSSDSSQRSQRRRSVKPRAKAIGAVFLVLVLLLSTTYIFREPVSQASTTLQLPEFNNNINNNNNNNKNNNNNNKDNNNNFGNYGDYSDPDSDINIDDYDDFRTFFENYYDTSDSTSGSQIPKTETGVGPSLTLYSQKGLPELSYSEIYEKGIESVVGIVASADGLNGYYWGSGIVLSADGYILTNAHLLSGAIEAEVVTHNGESYPAKLVGEESESDLAVLKIEATGLTPAVFGVSDELQVGDEVAAIGNPLGDELSGTMTNGIISAINRDVYVSGRNMTLLQTNTAINEGNSGGPLFNRYGQVIGITNMKMVARYTQVTIEGIAFAIPSSGAKAVIDRIIAGRPGIGITVGAIPDDAKEQYDLPDGLYVMSVTAGSDAEAKGIQVGDVVTGANGIAVTTTQELLDIKYALGIGDSITLTVYRDGVSWDVEVLLVNMNDLY